jgi:hypothetical protein
MMLAAVFVTAVLASAGPRAPQATAPCLHDTARQTPTDRDRSVAALGAARAINTAESAYAAAQAKNGSGRGYGSRDELAPYIDGARYDLAANAEIAPGFKLTLDATQKGYWFEIVDKTDACGFRYISNQTGVIFAAQPIR